MRIKLRSFFVFLFLWFCDVAMSFDSAMNVPKEDILSKDKPKKENEDDVFSSIFSNDYSSGGRGSREDFFAIYFGRELFSSTFSWEDLKRIFNKGEGRILKRLKNNRFLTADAFYYRCLKRFFNSPHRLFFDIFTFCIFSKRAFLFRDSYIEYSYHFKKSLFFTLQVGWEYNDYTFDYGKDIDDVKYNKNKSLTYDFSGMTMKEAIEVCGGTKDKFLAEKKKVDLKYCKNVTAIAKRDGEFSKKAASINTRATNSEGFVFVFLYKWFFAFGPSYYSAKYDPANSTFIFRFLLKVNTFYSIRSINYIFAGSKNFEKFAVDAVLDRCISKPSFCVSLCLCFGYKNWEIELSFALFSKSSEDYSGKFYSLNLLNNRLPISIAFRNRFFCL